MTALFLAAGAPLHHDPAFSTNHLFLATVVAVMLVVITTWAAARGSGWLTATTLSVLAVAWIVVDPIHSPTIYTFLRSHAVTPGDLLALPALAVAAVVAARKSAERGR